MVLRAYCSGVISMDTAYHGSCVAYHRLWGESHRARSYKSLRKQSSQGEIIVTGWNDSLKTHLRRNRIVGRRDAAILAQQKSGRRQRLDVLVHTLVVTSKPFSESLH